MVGLIGSCVFDCLVLEFRFVILLLGLWCLCGLFLFWCFGLGVAWLIPVFDLVIWFCWLAVDLVALVVVCGVCV